MRGRRVTVEPGRLSELAEELRGDRARIAAALGLAVATLNAKLSLPGLRSAFNDGLVRAGLRPTRFRHDVRLRGSRTGEARGVRRTSPPAAMARATAPPGRAKRRTPAVRIERPPDGTDCALLFDVLAEGDALTYAEMERATRLDERGVREAVFMLDRHGALAACVDGDKVTRFRLAGEPKVRA